MMTAEQFRKAHFGDAGRYWNDVNAQAYATSIADLLRAQLAEKEREIDRLQSWLAEADQGFGGFFSTLASIEKAAKAEDTTTILSVAKYCRESEKKWDLGKFDAKLKAAEARAEAAEQRLQEAQALYEKLAIRADELKAEVKSLAERLGQREAELEQLRTELRVTKLRALSAESLAGIADPKEVAGALALPSPPKEAK